MKLRVFSRLLLAGFVLVSGLGGTARPPHPVPSLVAAFDWRLPAGFPTPCVPEDNPMTEAKVALGRRLFYDTRLSANGTQSCGSCHAPGLAFTDGRARAQGSTGMRHPRGSMSLANVAYNSSMTWVEAHRDSLEEQQLGPMLNREPVELGLSGREADVLARLAADREYVAAFRTAFPGEPMDLKRVRKAIASFERTLLSGDSPYDRWVWSDDASAMSDSARRGMRLFFSERLNCAKCHAGFTFSGPVRFDGLPPAEPEFVDTGLGGPFRAPTLRNIAVTGPYMHDGRLGTLDEVVDYYARGGGDGAGKTPRIRAFTISGQERRDLIAFLNSLTDAGFLTDPRFADPGEARM